MGPEGPQLNPLWLQDYRQRKKFIDLHIYPHPRRPDNVPIVAHMVVIGSSTPRFHELIKPLEDSLESIKELIVPGVSRTSLEIVVDCLYTGTVNGLTDTNVLDVLSTAHKLTMSHVQKSCEKYIKEVMKIGFHNVVQILNSLNLALVEDKTTNDNYLLHTCSNFLITHLSQMTIETDYWIISKDIMLKLIKKAHLHMQKLVKATPSTDLSSLTINLLVFVLNWLIVQGADRMAHVSEIIAELPLSQVNLKVVERVMEKFRGHEAETNLNIVIGKVLLARGAQAVPSTTTTSNSPVSSSSTCPPNSINKPSNKSVKGTTSNSVTSTTTTTTHRSSVSVKMARSNASNSNRGVKRPPDQEKMTVVSPCPKTLKKNGKSFSDSETPSNSPSFISADTKSVSFGTHGVDKYGDDYDDDDIDQGPGTSRGEEGDDGTFFYLSGYELSTRKLRSFNLRGKKVQNVAFYFISEYVDSCLVYHDRKVYVLGGQKGGNNVSTDVHIYDMDKGAWTAGPSMLEGRCEFSAIYLDDYIYVAGGDQFTQHGRRKKGMKITGSWDGINCVERLKISATKPGHPEAGWQVLDYMHCMRHNFGFAALGNKLYAVGGNASEAGKCTLKASNTTECLDPNVEVKEGSQTIYGQWTMKAPMKRPRIGHCLIAARGRLYAFGGGSEYNGSSEKDATKTKSVEIYDPDKDVWTPGPPMNRKRKYFGAFLHGPFIYAVGGDKDKDGPTIERLDLDKQVWVIVADSTTLNDPEAHFWSVALQA